MPSAQERREQGAALQLHHRLQLHSYTSSLQAHCRSDSLLAFAPSAAPVVDMESWFPPASGSPFEGVAGESCREQGTTKYGFPQGSESMPMACSADNAFPRLADLQSDSAWWPPISAQAMPSDILNVNVNVDDLNAPCEVVSVAPGAPAQSKSRARKFKSDGSPSQKGKSVSAPTSPSELRPAKEKSNLGVQKGKGNGKRPISQRENHIWSERQRRKGMNYLFSSLRSLLPHPTSKTDKSTVVGEIIKYIQSLQVKLEMLTTKRQQVMAGLMLPSRAAFVSNGGLTLVDHSNFGANSMTAISALPPPGRESCLQSYLGANVGLHACGLNVFITTSSPRGRRGLLQQLLVTIQKHDLDVINATISTSNASIFHCLHCQASQDAELLNNDLHSALQSVISNFGLIPQF